MDVPESKKCWLCKETKSINEFASKKGRNKRCKECLKNWAICGQEVKFIGEMKDK